MSKRVRTKKGKAPFTPTRGGDGGALPRTASGWSKNDRDVIAGESIRGCSRDAWAAFVATLIETADPDDRAHAVHVPEADGAGREITSGREVLLPACELPVLPDGTLPGRPRRYPPSQVVGTGDRRVGIDSMFDVAAATASRLQGQGIELGWRTRATGKELRHVLVRMLDIRPGERIRDRVRAVLEPEWRTETNADERTADVLLSRHGYRSDGQKRRGASNEQEQ